MKKSSKLKNLPRNEIARAVAENPAYRHRVETPKKGKGSYRRSKRVEY